MAQCMRAYMLGDARQQRVATYQALYAAGCEPAVITGRIRLRAAAIADK
jgi:hypothetical protein